MSINKSTSSTVFVAALLSVGAVAGASAVFADSYRGSSFAETWQLIKNAGSYESGALPIANVTLADMLSWTGENIREAAWRTLDDRSDVLPHFQKLVHADGICMAGTWNITAANPYTGYFADGSRGQIIARVSEASGHPEFGDYRAFGFAGKIYPTADAGSSAKYQTANFFTVDDLGGTKTPHFTEQTLTNQPPTTKNSQVLAALDKVLAIGAAFGLADSHIGVRQVYEISELGLAPGARAKTPAFIAISASSDTQKFDAIDFRDELRLENYGGSMRFDIAVGSTRESLTKIGYIEMTDYALSVGCDHNLHFHHPKWRDDVNY